ncbi:hypothetical protein AQPE_0693 [Aquipluma nitroreducens]|uniref:Uncharacterized protein n=1 Tax=Aquipluma nitroreducens TaxID=2010828 RepID=A0A5K7S4T5_9BACT|nr:hypothetical protein AQPE_0693 [Aquipluma nitroreducens]
MKFLVDLENLSFPDINKNSFLKAKLKQISGFCSPTDLF